MTDLDALYEIARTRVVPVDLADRKEPSRSAGLEVNSADAVRRDRMGRMLDFLDLLKREKIPYSLEREMPDS